MRPDKYNEVQPDVLVARYAGLTDHDLPRAPVLAVEVISPTSRLRDAQPFGVRVVPADLVRRLQP